MIFVVDYEEIKIFSIIFKILWKKLCLKILTQIRITHRHLTHGQPEMAEGRRLKAYCLKGLSQLTHRIDSRWRMITIHHVTYCIMDVIHHGLR